MMIAWLALSQFEALEMEPLCRGFLHGTIVQGAIPHPPNAETDAETSIRWIRWLARVDGERKAPL